MSNTRKDILDLLAKGKITADEAADMLSALTAPTPPAAPATPEPPKPPAAPEPPDYPLATKNGKRKWFRIRIRDLESGKNKVSVNIPMGMLNVGFKIANRFAPELDGLDWKELQEMMVHAESGLLVDVQDEDSRDHVQIYID
jgi:hypothetical protein